MLRFQHQRIGTSSLRAGTKHSRYPILSAFIPRETKHVDHATSEQFWEQHYRAPTREPSGKPSAVLVQYASDLPAGRSLDLGCSRGDDVIWLANQGWTATGADVSTTAVEAATQRARSAGLGRRVRFEQHDLAVTFPEGEFDLVTALFFQSPVDFPRSSVLQRAAKVAKNGLLLIVEHASAAPWSWSPEAGYPTMHDTLASLELSSMSRVEVFVGTPERVANGPEGQTALVADNVIALMRK
ncbi:methyltransferase domain-containing protein (plasmid) [Devosia sp. A8/3-2]|nr:methyltransferase domain-containing protein [Devosia sp. A8/3-2]